MDFRLPKAIFRNLSSPSSDFRDWSDYVISLRTDKQLGPQAGTWSVELVPTQSVDGSLRITLDNFESVAYRMIKPMDIILIGIEATNHLTGRQEENIFMLGIVDRVYKIKTQQGDSVSRAITISGKDFTKVFIKDEVAMAPELVTNENLVAAFGIGGEKRVQFMDWIRGLVNGGQDNIFLDSHILQAVYWVVANMPAMQIDSTYFNGAAQPVDFFKVMLTGRLRDKLFDANMNMYSGNMVNYMCQLLDMMFYEIWVDTLPPGTVNNPSRDKATPVLIVRPKPYDFKFEVDSDGKPVNQEGVTIAETKFDTFNEAAPLMPITIGTWEDLTSPITGIAETIHESDILRKAMGVSDEEVFSMYKLFADKDNLATSILGRFGYYFPIVDIDAVRRYGLREMQGHSKLIGSPTDLPKKWGPAATGLTEEDFDAITKIGPLTQDQTNKLEPASFFTREKRDRLWRWNRYNHLFESGPMTIKGRNMFVGTKVFFPDETLHALSVDGSEFIGGLQSYCIGVGHEWSFGGHWLTTVDLIRGHNKNHIFEYHQLNGYDKPVGERNNVFMSNLNLEF